jgi:hypothetical protein
LNKLKVREIENQFLGIELPADKFKEGEEVTVVKGSQREFNIRWWGFGFSCLVLGLTIGILMGMHI